MRITRLLCTRVGRWPLTTLSFGRGLSIVFGPNEAGKSTALRAIEALLFPLSTEELKPLVSPRSPAQFEATISLERDGEGGPEAITWRRSGKTLLDAGDQPLSPELQHAWLWETTRHDFRALYGLGHERLRDERQLLGKNSTLGRVLAEIAAGGRDIAAVQERFQSDLDKRYVKGGRDRRSLTFALSKVKDAADRMKEADAARSHRAYRGATDESARAKEQVELLDEKIAARRKQASELDRLLFAPPALATIAELGTRAAALRTEGPTPPLSWASAARSMLERRRNVQTELERARLVLQEANEALTALVPARLVLDFEDELTTAIEARTALVEAGSRRARLAEQLEARTQKLAATLQSMGLGAEAGRHEGEGDLARFVPAERARVALAKAFEALAEAENVGRERSQARASAEARSEEAREAVTRLGEALEVASLRALRTEVGEAPSPASLASRGAVLDEREQEIRAAGGRLGFSASLSLHEQRALPVPAEETLAGLRARFEHATASLATATQRARDAEDKAALSARNVVSEEQALPEAADADLLAARARRDEAWQALRLAEVDPGKDALARAPLLLSYESHARDLDATVDAVLRHVDAIARLAELRRTARALSGEAETAHAARAAAEAPLAEVTASWAALWRSFGLSVPEIEQASFARDHARFVKEIDQLLAARAVLVAEEKSAEDARQRLRDGLATWGVAAPTNATLPALLARLDDRVAEAEKHNAALAAASSAAEKAETETKRLQQGATKAEETIRTARATLRQTVESLALPTATREDEDKLRLWVAEGKSLVDQLRQLTEARESLAMEDAAHARRLAQLDHVWAGLEERGVPLAETTKAPLAQTQALIALLQKARDTRAREDAREKASLAFEDRERAALEQEKAFRAHLEGAGLPSLSPESEELAAILVRSETLHAIDQDHLTLQNQVKTQAQLPLEELSARLGQRTADDLQVERDSLAGELATLEAERNRAHAQAIETSRILLALGNLGDHDALRQDHESALTLLVDELAETVTLKGASLLMNELQESLAHTDQRAALLGRASGYLSGLTGGAFRAIQTDDEDATLHVLRAGEDEPLGVSALSEGTRDQVFLALRLAVAHRQLESKRLPFVLDDVLVHFDDARSLAALRAFAQLSEHTQVILFTHHRHLLDLAREAGIPFEAIELAAPSVEAAPSEESPGSGSVRTPAPRTPRRPVARAPESTAALLAIAPEGAEEMLLEKLGELGGSAGNGRLRGALGWEEAVYDEVKAALVGGGRLALGKGKGGSVKLPVNTADEALPLFPNAPENSS